LKRKVILPLLLFFLIIIIWEFFVYIFNIPEYLLPYPHKVLIKTYILRAGLINDFIITFLESFLGFLLGSIIGIVFAFIMAHSKSFELSLYPYAIALKTIPIVAIAPLIILWFGTGIISKIVVSALICFFPAIVNTFKGLKTIDQEIIDLFNSLSASNWKKFIKVELPSSLPYIFSALKISSTLSVIGAIVAEFTGANAGLGFRILVASYRIETVNMFVGIFAASILGIVFFILVGIAESYLLPWHKKEFSLY